MAFVKFEDLTGEAEIVVFPKTFEGYAKLLTRDKLLLIEGHVSSKGNNGQSGSEKKIVADSISEIDAEPALSTSNNEALAGPGAKAVESTDQKVYIKLPDTDDGNKLINLKRTIDTFVGPTRVIIVIGDESNKQAIRLPGGFDHNNQEALGELVSIVGADNLKIS